MSSSSELLAETTPEVNRSSSSSELLLFPVTEYPAGAFAAFVELLEVERMVEFDVAPEPVVFVAVPKDVEVVVVLLDEVEAPEVPPVDSGACTMMLAVLVSPVAWPSDPEN